MPKLSIVIPVYNVEKYLRECLDSIVHQTLKDIEIIIVNDCSPDHSEEIIFEFIKKDPRIVYIKHEINKGLSGARNTGIENATGEWIAFIDSDDFLAKDIYSKIIAHCEQYHANFGVFGRKMFGIVEGKTITPAYFYPSISSGSIIDHTNYEKILTGTPTKIFKRQDLLDHNLRFLENITTEDWIFHYQYIVCVKPKIAAINNIGYYYRRNEQSIMGQISKNGVNPPKIATLICKFLKEKGVFDLYKYKLRNECFFFLFSIYSQLIEDVKEEYFEHLIAFCNAFDPSEDDIKHSPALLFGRLSDMSLYHKDLLLKNFLPYYEVSSDKWYRFGQLSIINKLKKVLHVFIKKYFLPKS
ncbi:MAG: glycosyltransferase family 2 protein [Brevinema sp.]